ncbi:hypothetical protein [Massilia sp. CF038]|uniref:hypothetical protein n=1 Tax=Massilia sp. CF038 TaxID=1881045 RepID=UPI00116136C9|nr:hypothetical protein [Massilia sp. CF038]
MDSAQKYAYRYLIYEATLRIRPIAHVGAEWWERWNLVYWLRQRKQIRGTGQVADWLHNLALFSAIDFDGFDEDAFWSGLEWLRSAFPTYGFGHYRDIFLYAIFEFNEGRWPTLEEQFAITKQSAKNE